VGPTTQPMGITEPMGPYDDEIWMIRRSNWRLMPWRMILIEREGMGWGVV
jgi:hypothetical protein